MSLSPVLLMLATSLSGDPLGWTVVNEHSEGTVARDAAQRPTCLRLTVTRLAIGHGARYGVAQEGPRVEKGTTYDVAFDAHNEGRPVGLVFSLESPDGKRVLARTTLPEVGGEWARYTVALVAHGSAPKTRLVVAPIERTTIWLDAVSATPRPAPQK